MEIGLSIAMGASAYFWQASAHRENQIYAAAGSLMFFGFAALLAFRVWRIL